MAEALAVMAVAAMAGQGEQAEHQCPLADRQESSPQEGM